MNLMMMGMSLWMVMRGSSWVGSRDMAFFTWWSWWHIGRIDGCSPLISFSRAESALSFVLSTIVLFASPLAYCRWRLAARMVSHCLLDRLRRSILLDRHNEDLHKQTEVVYSRALNHSCFAIALSDHFPSRYHEHVAFVAFQRAFSIKNPSQENWKAAGSIKSHQLLLEDHGKAFSDDRDSSYRLLCLLVAWLFAVSLNSSIAPK